MKDRKLTPVKPSLSFREHLGALLLFAVLTTVFTWPLVLNLDRVNGAGDPAVMVWSMAWISHAIFTEPATLYGANFFYPTPDALAYTDLLLPSALFTAPFYFITGNALLGFSIILFLTFVLSGYTTFLLSHRLLNRSGRGTTVYRYALPAALFAGAIYAFSPYRLAHITQLNSMTTYFLPLILLFLHRYLEDGRRPRDLFFAGLFFTLNALSGLYYGVFAALMMAVFYVIWHLVHREPPRLKDFAYGTPIFAVFGVVLALLLGPYLALSGADDHSRSLATVVGGSVIPQALLASPPESWLLGWTPEALNITNEDGKPMYELTLIPGPRRRGARGLRLSPALPARLRTLFRPGPVRPFRARNTDLLLRSSIAARRTARAPPLLPYLRVRPRLRQPSGPGPDVVHRDAVCRRPRGSRDANAFATTPGKESRGSPRGALRGSGAGVRPDAPDGPFYRPGTAGARTGLQPTWWKNATESTVVAEVPFASRNDPFRETPRMYRSTHGWWKLINGYASYFPEGYGAKREALNDLPASEGLAVLHDFGVDYVIVHPDEYAEDGKDGAAVLRAVEKEPSLERVAGGKDAILFWVGG